VVGASSAIIRTELTDISVDEVLDRQLFLRKLGSFRNKHQCTLLDLEQCCHSRAILTPDCLIENVTRRASCKTSADGSTLRGWNSERGCGPVEPRIARTVHSPGRLRDGPVSIACRLSDQSLRGLLRKAGANPARSECCFLQHWRTEVGETTDDGRQLAVARPRANP
jgi:hypothetical protein